MIVRGSFACDMQVCIFGAGNSRPIKLKESASSYLQLHKDSRSTYELTRADCDYK